MSVTVTTVGPDPDAPASSPRLKSTNRSYRDGVSVERTPDGGLDVYGSVNHADSARLGGHAAGAWTGYRIRTAPATTGQDGGE